MPRIGPHALAVHKRNTLDTTHSSSLVQPRIERTTKVTIDAA